MTGPGRVAVPEHGCDGTANGQGQRAKPSVVQ